MINYVSNLQRDLRSGGFSSMNVAMYEALLTRHSVHYAGPIDPPIFRSQKAWSKALRIGGLQGDFYFFSDRRLEVIAREVRERCRAEARLDFFHGFTPWVCTKPDRPYVAFSDCTFHDYIEIFHRGERFKGKDRARIERAEAAWLKNASRVLLSSRWAADRAVSQYGLDAGRVGWVRSCGEFKMPERDTYAGSKAFAFVSTDFRAKGGAVVLSAFREIRKRHRDVSLTIVGHRPRRLAAEPGVEFVGFLRKEVPSELDRFRQILARARAIVHPTLGDVAPLIIVEAGYFGCPAISSRSFAIPELVDDGSSGLLIDDPTQIEAVANAMVTMLEHEDEYRRMRQAAWNKSRNEYSRLQADQRVLAYVDQVVERSGTPAA